MQDAIDLFLDEQYDGEIELVDLDGKSFTVIQVALIPLDKKLYAIVIDKEDFEKGNFEDTGYVLHIDDDNNKIDIVKNVNTISEVFEIYDRLFESKEGN